MAAAASASCGSSGRSASLPLTNAAMQAPTSARGASASIRRAPSRTISSISDGQPSFAPSWPEPSPGDHGEHRVVPSRPARQRRPLPETSTRSPERYTPPRPIHRFQLLLPGAAQVAVMRRKGGGDGSGPAAGPGWSQQHDQHVAHCHAHHDLAARREPRRQRSIPRQPRHVWRTGGRIGAYSATESDRPAGMAGDVRRQVSDRCEVRGYRKLGHCLGLLPGHLRCHGTARRAAAAGCQGVACRRWPCLPR